MIGRRFLPYGPAVFPAEMRGLKPKPVSLWARIKGLFR